jgi:hypothetical protein
VGRHDVAVGPAEVGFTRLRILNAQVGQGRLTTDRAARGRLGMTDQA